jgi:hypothetical protein
VCPNKSRLKKIGLEKNVAGKKMGRNKKGAGKNVCRKKVGFGGKQEMELF